MYQYYCSTGAIILTVMTMLLTSTTITGRPRGHTRTNWLWLHWDYGLQVRIIRKKHGLNLCCGRGVNLNMCGYRVEGLGFGA